MGNLHPKKMFLEFLEKNIKNITPHKLIGRDENIRKKEFKDYANKIGRPLSYILWGNWQLQPYKVSGTSLESQIDDLYFLNNPAMQQMWDDIRRTVIINLSFCHEVIQKKLGREITTETINNYMESLNITIPGAALSSDYLAEPHPGLTRDGRSFIFTGDDALADEIDDGFKIDFNKLYPAEQAELLKAAIGKDIWQVCHIPTIVVRSCDSTATGTWSAIQSSKSLASAYNINYVESLTVELAYYISKTAISPISEILPGGQSARLNNPRGVNFGSLADMVQTSRRTNDPVTASLDVVAAGAALYDQIWLGGYIYGGGLTEIASAAYTDDVLDDFCYYGVDYGIDKYGGYSKAPRNLRAAFDLATEVTLYGMEQFESYPTLLETYSEGSQRAFILASSSGIAAAAMTGDSQLGLYGWNLSQQLHKEVWGWLGSLGYDQQDQCGLENVGSYQSDEGNLLEIRGPNYPNYSMDAGHMGGYAGIVSAAHAARGDAFAINPLIKVAFASPGLVFNWSDVRLCFSQGAKREFRAAGDRSLVMPSV